MRPLLTQTAFFMLALCAATLVAERSHAEPLAVRIGYVAWTPDPGPVLCSCFNVGVNTILTAIEQQGLCTVEAVGAALQAGTNCGSCRPEIATLLRKAALPPKAAE